MLQHSTQPTELHDSQKLAQRTAANTRLSARVHKNLLQGNSRLLSRMGASVWQGRGVGKVGRGIHYVAFLPLPIHAISADLAKYNSGKINS